VFLSNPIEEKRLKKTDYKQKIAESIYDGIKRFKFSREKLLVKD
jgi:N-acetylmuramoyl-L-alanine amidase